MPSWSEVFAASLPYDRFLEIYGTPERRTRWEQAYAQLELRPAHRRRLASFRRQMNVLCVAATWCGDCAAQGAILRRIAEGCPRIDLRFLERDNAPEDVLRNVRINGGQRVPVVVFLSEDFEDCGHYGDRPLSFYRDLWRQQAAPACSTGVVPPAPRLMQQGLREWLVEFERIQLMLRLTGRLRALHGD